MTASSTLSTPDRKLGLFERFELASASVGCASMVTFLATLPPSASSQATPARVKQAIVHLRRSYPLLRAGISDGRTRIPSWNVAADVDVDAVFRLVTSSAGTEAEILDGEVNSGLTFNGATGPLWRVTLFERAEGPRVALTFSHVICDGAGGRNLFQHLLQLLHPSSDSELAQLPELREELPATMESTFAMKKLSPGAMLRIAWDELVLPSVASLLPKPVKIVPRMVAPDFTGTESAVMRVPAESVEKLKALAKAHGIKTLHPLLMGCALTACFLASNSSNARKKAAVMKTLTPISAREQTPNAPYATGNFLTALLAEHKVRPSTRFFELCRIYASDLASDKKRKEAIEMMLSFTLLPDGKPTQAKVALDPTKPEKRYPLTGWDKYHLDYRTGKVKVDRDVNVSNVGLMKATGWETESGFEVAWAQASIPVAGKR